MLFKIYVHFFLNVFFTLHPAQARLHFFSDFSLPFITTTAKFLDYSFKPPRKFVFFREIAVSQLSRALKFHIAPQDT